MVDRVRQGNFPQAATGNGTRHQRIPHVEDQYGHRRVRSGVTRNLDDGHRRTLPDKVLLSEDLP
jgi:hypothetical protein